ncbi:MAG TPA: protease inhibitor I42 family protein [Candidatus Deferrimicrobium sp.]|nr:protease inhibitor I42 family protein [Candidatus Deferrimicrobium sp.]
MKRKMLFVVVTVVVLAVAATVVTLVLTRTAQGNKVTGDTFETTTGKTFTIALDANATSGYNWSQTTKDTNVVAYVDIAYVATASSTQVVGGSGTVTFTFKAVGKGTTTILFAYARPWESVPPSQTRTITVTVK